MLVRKRFPKAAQALTGIAFLVSGFDCMNNNDLIVMGIASFVVGTVNLAALGFFKKFSFIVKVVLLAVNAIFAFLSAYIYIQAGKDKIQYAWMAVGLLSIVVIFISYRKRSRSDSVNTMNNAV